MARRTIPLLLALLLMLVACGGDDTDSADSADAGNTDGEATSQGGVESGGGSMTIDGLDVPLPAGATIISDTTIDPARAVLASVPNDQFDSAVAVYDDFVATEAPEWDSVTAEAGGKSWQGTLGSSYYVVLVSAPLGTDDDVQISITATPSEE